MLAGLQNVTFEFGARAIVKDATWHIHPQERIGLVGYNGTGKSTILKLLAGEYQPSSGTVERSRNTSIGYLHQDLLSFSTNESILQVALHAFDRVKALEKEIAKLTIELEHHATDDMLLEYSDKLHQFEEAGGYTVEHKTEEVLQGLGFSNDDLKRPYKEFSGGWRMRVLLAKMILQQPDLLLLDEPTNHLDLHSTELLADSLNRYGGSYLLVSHDRYFISKTANKIWEIVDHQIKEFKGSYQEWVEWKERMSSEVKVQSVKSEKGAGNREDGKGGSEAVNKNKTQEIEANQISNVSSGKPINKSIQSAVKKELQKLQRQFQKIEEDIAQANKLKTELELQLAAPDIYADKQRFVQTEEKYKNVTSRLVQLNQDYEQTFEKIIELEEQ